MGAGAAGEIGGHPSEVWMGKRQSIFAGSQKDHYEESFAVSEGILPARKKTSQRHTAEELEVEVEAVPRNPKIEWEDNQMVIKASGWEAAYKHLQKIAKGVWNRDKACPSSKLRGYNARRRVYLDVHDGEVLHRVRVVDFEDGTFEIQQGTEIDLTEAEGEDSAEDPNDSAEQLPAVQAAVAEGAGTSGAQAEVAEVAEVPEVPEVAAPRASSRRGKAKKVAK